jgi:hypothetical protein
MLEARVNCVGRKVNRISLAHYWDGHRSFFITGSRIRGSLIVLESLKPQNCWKSRTAFISGAMSKNTQDAAARRRIDAAQTAFASTADLASALRRAEAAHGEHEKRTGQRDANWPDWYGAYMVAEQAGEKLPL